MKSMAAKVGRLLFGAVTLVSVFAWLAGARAAEAGINAWTPFGPEGTDVTILAVDPVNSSTLYARTPVGVYKSRDEGSTWSRVLDSPRVKALVIDPQNSTTLYVGTENRSSNYPNEIGAGVLKSTDGGRTWGGVNAGLPTVLSNGVGTVLSLAIDPSTPATLYAVVSNRAFKSTDGGETWKEINDGLSDTSFRALVVDPRTPTTLYAVTGKGLFKSTEGGASWVAVNTGVPVTSFGFLRADPVTPTTLYAGSLLDSRDAAGAVLFKSTDGGANWAAIGSGLPDAGGAWYVSDLLVDAESPTTLYAALSSRYSIGSGGIFKSLDGGASWFASDAGLPHKFVAALAIGRREPSTLYAGSFGDGLFRSVDGGGSWKAVNTGLPRTTAGCLYIDPQAPTTRYMVTSINLGSSYVSTLQKSLDRGDHWSVVGPIPGCVTFDPQSPTTMYRTGSHEVYKSTDGGVTWRSFGIGLDPSYRSFIGPLTIDPRTPTTLYVFAWRYSEHSMVDKYFEGVFKSTDGGETWRNIGVSTGFCSGCYFQQVTSIAIDSETPSNLYVANNLWIVKSADGGVTWSGCGDLHLNYYSVGGLTIDPQTPSTVYTSTSDGILKSIDGCRTWSSINNGLPSHADSYDPSRRTYSVRPPSIDPVTPTNLYTATEKDGPFKSTDGGETWSSLPLPPMAYYSGVTVDPLNPAILYTVTTAGAFTLEQHSNHRPVADPKSDMAAECTSPAGAEVTLDAGQSSDPDGDTLSYAWTGPFGTIEGSRPTVMLPLGISTITLVVSDGELESVPAVVTVDVRDTVAPTLNVTATPTLLWPPDRRMVEVAFQAAAGDRCDPSPAIVLLDVTSSEPEDAGPSGASFTGADFGTADRFIFLKADRFPKGTGRIYTITYRATDSAGNTATASASVSVPRSRQP